MATVAGFFEPQGSPAFKVRIGAPGQSQREFLGIMDTGFTGFVMMPWMSASPLGFAPRTAAPVEHANGVINQNSLAEGIVSLGERSHQGPVLFQEDATEVLLGMEFLKAFGMILIVMPTTVALIDQRDALPHGDPASPSSA